MTTSPLLAPAVRSLSSPVIASVSSRPAAACVVVLTGSDVLWASLARSIGDDTTAIAHCRVIGELVAGDRPDVVVLDYAALPDVARVVRRIRRRWLTVTIVVVRVADEVDVGRLLDAGADDAVVDGSPVLQSRLHAHARRARTHNAAMRIAVGDVVFDRESHRVWCAGHEVDLSRTEEAIFDCLFWHSPQAVDTETLVQCVWGEALDAKRCRALRVYIGYLRNKLEASRNLVIRNVRGVGYALGPIGSGPARASSP